MAVQMIDYELVRGRLRSLGVSLAELARLVVMEPADVSRALSGQPTEPATLFRLAQGLELLNRGHRAAPIRAPRRGHVFSAEHRANLSQAARKRHQRDRARVAAGKGKGTR
jgi:hypothetical protein